MKIRIIKILVILILINSKLSFSQEYKNIKSYQKETENKSLVNGCWLKKDRKYKTDIWNNANIYNLRVENGSEKYKTICQIRDFYLWFDVERKKQGHEIKWIGIASIAANQLSKLDIAFIRIFIVRNKELVKFANQGAIEVLAFAFPQLKTMLFSNKLVKGKNAVNWDNKYGKTEQCEILEPLYIKLSEKSINKLERMAKGKGIYNLAVPKKLKFEGEIINCKSRFEHGIKKLIPFYNSSK
ncbi:MAG: hypothetical protein JXA16_15140 [Bacteroidales bacterium]|nr:hypothetical protein [Bacteroidales bacterium]